MAVARERATPAADMTTAIARLVSADATMCGNAGVPQVAVARKTALVGRTRSSDLVDAELLIAFVAERSPDAGARRDRDVADAVARSEDVQRAKDVMSRLA